MAPLLLLVAVWFSAIVIVHYSVAFLERSKASWWKAATLAVFFSIGGSVAARYAPAVPYFVRWVLCFAIVSSLVWLLFRLRMWNNFAVAACYLAGSHIVASIGIRIAVAGSKTCEGINSLWC